MTTIVKVGNTIYADKRVGTSVGAQSISTDDTNGKLFKSPNQHSGIMVFK